MKRGRKPAASRGMLEFLGKRVDYRRAMRGWGLLVDTEVDRRITSLVSNEMPEADRVFEVEQF